jgi:hypothetical protein
MLNETPQQTKSTHRDTFTPTYRVLVILLLLGLLALQAFNQFNKSALTSACQVAIEKANIVISKQNALLSSQLNNYDKAVYKTASVDNINKQIFMANEFEFTALNMIAMQNAALLDVTTNCK